MYFVWFGLSGLLVAFIIAATIAIERRKSYQGNGDSRSALADVSLDNILRDERAAGKRLLGEAASFEPVGNVGGLDDLLRRGEAWVDRVSDAFADHDEPEMHERWTNDPRWRDGPTPITREQIDRYVVAQIRERLDVLRGFHRELRERGAPAPEPDPVKLLSERYRLGRQLQERLVWPDEGAPTSRQESVEAQRRERDLVREWAEETWPILLKHFQGVEREFYGPGDPLGERGFWLSFKAELRAGQSPRSYLDAKLRLLEPLLPRAAR